VRSVVLLSFVLAVVSVGDGTNVVMPAHDASDVTGTEAEVQPDVIPDVPSAPDLFEAAPVPDVVVELEVLHPLDVQPDEVTLLDAVDPDLHEVEAEAAGEATAQDIAPEVLPPFELVPCQDHEECNLKGICLDDAMGGKSCFPWCDNDSECPQGYVCRLPYGFQDTACFPAAAALCKPCSQDSDCKPKAFPIVVSCLNYGPDGKFCGSECTLDGKLPCPQTHFCGQVAGGEELRCMPKPGTGCACQPWMEGMATPCYGESAIGKCYGERLCKDGALQPCSASAPTPEFCDGKDNNCNGLTDEGLEVNAPTCILDFGTGACQIPKQCLQGKWTCVKVALPDICTVQSLECFWWGDTVDHDGDYYPDLCDPDDDGDGFADEEDCQPLDPEMNPAAQELCDGIDGDCNGVGDFDQFGDMACKAESLYGQCPGISQCVDGAKTCSAVAPGPGHCPEPEEGCEFFSLPEYLDADKDKIPDICDSDLDGDGTPNADDNCPELGNPTQLDADQDGKGDACDPDDDNDGVDDTLDCCPYLFNPTQTNTDGDSMCDMCDPDDDNDWIPDEGDNCPLKANPDQANNDQDEKGDACDPDDDNDEVLDGFDNCPWISNLDQSNNDGDKDGDACDPDDDNDTVKDEKDNCPFVHNMKQEDQDKDGIGNACDKDIDGDGADNDKDNCPLDPNADQNDMDGDKLGDVCDPDRDGDGAVNSLDNCPDLPNPDQKDKDKDCPPTPYPAATECGDACDSDVDGDGKVNSLDNCPDVYNPDQADLDNDGVGDACTDDKDGDGAVDSADNCPKTYNPDQADTDGDKLGNACDADDDNDNWFDVEDNCPFVPNPDQKDSNNNGPGDACE